MRQKIVIKVSMNADKCRCKALKIAVCAPGVESAALTGEDKNQVEIVGNEIDSVELTRRLRKSFACAELVSVGEAKEKEADQKKEADEKKPEVVLAPPYYCYPYYNYYEVREPTTCTIL